ncbi:Thioredoxin-like fold [Penicillium camemberti]|uniref:Thioredoxin-like fold n=1 Tax=Penicillium camemberti (strain FM 013) TaxID=1429867 RepID=A0A0G4PHI4_PENC3|nr:Thioredoxin-like fold [Penicillium camemberti]
MSAQEEFNQLVNSNRSRFTSHPEDNDFDSDPHFSDDEPSSRLRSRQTLDSSDEENDADMVSSRTANANYHIPNTVYEANTGPKGVIADAQAFERARKKSFRRTLLSVAGLDSNSPSFSSKSTRDDAPLAPGDQSSASEDDDEARFLRKWRQSRMHELQGRNNRRPSPRGRRFGSVETVDAVGYLDAIEKVTSDTVVVVCIYDHEFDDSAIVEECLVTIARRQPTVRFIKMHQDIAEMDHITAPALLAYRGGDVFATIVDVLRNIPRGRSCSADSLEDLLKLHRVL